MAPASQPMSAPHRRRAALALQTFGLAAALASFCLPAQAQADGPPARGFIVKLKSTAAAGSSASTTASTTEKAQAARSRMAEIAARRRIAYLDSRPTALDGAQVLNYGRWLSATEAKAEAQRLRADPDVEWVMVNSLEKRLGVAPAVPANFNNDPIYRDYQWWAKAPGGQVGIPNIPAAWGIVAGRTITPVVTAVLDSGVRTDHPDLTGQLLSGYDFVSEYDRANDGNTLDPDPTDPGDWVSSADKNASASFGDECDVEGSSWHGTHIAGQLAGAHNNGIGVVGMLWQLQAANGGTPVVLPVRVAGKCGALVNDIIEGMYWAAGISYPNSPPLNPNPARIISLSFGSASACNSTDSGAYVEAINKLAEAGVLVVAAAGNGAGTAPGAAGPSRPANCQGVLGVTAVNQDGSKAYYANLITGVGVTGIATVGGDAFTASGSSTGIASTSNAGTTTPVAYDSVGYYEYRAGTSFAAPIVAGVAAMMLAIDPELTPLQLINALQAQATPWPSSISSAPLTCDANNSGLCRCTTSYCGQGLLNASAAVNFATTNVGNFALALASNGAVAPGSITSTYQPSRGSSTTRPRSSGGGGGGGGAVHPAWLGGLVLAIGVLAARRRHG